MMNQELIFPPIGLGTFSIPNTLLPNLLQFAAQKGYTLIDTAQKYNNEEIVGNNISDKHIMIQTKVHGAYLCGNRKYLRLNSHSVCAAFERARLRLEREPDIFLLHSPFDGVEKYYEQLLMLKTKGSVKAVGICNVSICQIESLKLSVGAYPDLVQIEMHPYYNNLEVVRFCKQNGIIVESRSPFAHGDALVEWNTEECLQRLSLKYQKSIPQIILRWEICHGVIPLPRSANKEHVEENINVFDFDLTQKEIDEIDDLNRDMSFGFRSKYSFV